MSKWFLTEDKVYHIDLGNDEWIKIKSVLTAGDYEDIVKEYGEISDKDGIPATAVLKALIVDWSFTENNIKLTINRNSLRRFSFTGLIEMVEIVNKQLGDSSPFKAVVISQTTQ